MKSNTADKKVPLALPDSWSVLPRMSFTTTPAPSAADQQRANIAFGVSSPDKLLNAFHLRERRLKSGA